jgi:hypothetical protein
MRCGSSASGCYKMCYKIRPFNELNLSNPHKDWGLVSAEGIEPSTY